MAYIVIQDWMSDDLGLKGNDLLVYAIIFGFSQDGESRFTGNLNYLARRCGKASKQGIKKNLGNLVSLGLIDKFETQRNGVKFCEYAVKQSCIPYNKVAWGIQQSLPNNKEYIKDRKEISISNDIDKEKTEKIGYGEYENVMLTDEEYTKWINECPNALHYIERLSEYMAMKKTDYKNHLAVLRNWYRRDTERQPKKADSFMDELARLYEEDGNGG